MVGSWMWNAVAGIAGCLFAFTGAIVNNPWITSFERAIYGFVVAFILMFGVRWFIGSFLGLMGGSSEEDSASSSGVSSGVVNFETETPDELDSLRRLIRDNIMGDADAEPAGMKRESQMPPVYSAPAAAPVAAPAASMPPKADAPAFDDMPALTNPVADQFADFSSFGSMDDLFQSLDNPAPKPGAAQSHNGTGSTGASGGPAAGRADLTAEELANVIRTSFLDD